MAADPFMFLKFIPCVQRGKSRKPVVGENDVKRALLEYPMKLTQGFHSLQVQCSHCLLQGQSDQVMVNRRVLQVKDLSGSGCRDGFA